MRIAKGSGRGERRAIDERLRPIVTALAILIVRAMLALVDDEATEVTAARTERPSSLNQSIGIKSYLLSPPPWRLERRQVYRRD